MDSLAARVRSGPVRSNFELEPEHNDLSVSVVIPTHGRGPKLAATLAALADQEYPQYEVIVVSTPDDETERIIDSLRPAFGDHDVRRVVQKNDSGASGARNMGIEAASGEIIAFTDDDCLPPVDWLSSMVAVFQRYDVASVAGLLLPHPRVRERLGARVNEHQTMKNQLPTTPENDDSVVTGGLDLGAFGTGNIGYRREIIEDADVRFDPELDRGEDAAFQRSIAAETDVLFAWYTVTVWHDRDQTFWELMMRSFTNGKNDAKTNSGRGTLGSLLGLVGAPILLVSELYTHDDSAVGASIWLADQVGRLGLIAGVLDRRR